jgi:hypothetical protein
MNNFGTQDIAVGVPAQFNTGMNWEYLQVSNESGYQLDLNFSGIGSRGFNPWQRDDIAITKGYTGTLVITASNPGNVDITKFPTSYIQVNAYIPGELTQPMSVALSRLQNIGNPVDSNVVSTSANKIQNDGNTAGTAILETTVLGATTNQNATNDGLWNLSVLIAGVLHQFLKTNAAGNLLQLGNASDVTEILGELLIDGALIASAGKFGITAAGDLLDGSGGNTVLKARGASNAVVLQSPPGTDVLDAGYNGVTFHQNILLPGGGGWSACASVGVSAPAIGYPGAFSFTHNFGFIPQWMIFCPGTRGGTGEGSCTWGVDNYNNTTTCSITLGSQINGVLIGGRNS